jgi:hypothetical protein
MDLTPSMLLRKVLGLATLFRPAERSLFTRERNDGLYTTFTSLAGKMFDELVINALVA